MNDERSNINTYFFYDCALEGFEQIFPTTHFNTVSFSIFILNERTTTHFSVTKIYIHIEKKNMRRVNIYISTHECSTLSCKRKYVLKFRNNRKNTMYVII